MIGRLKRVHLLVGSATLVVFLGTGGYMRLNFPDLYEGDETIRYLFRSRHVYILFSSLLNILLGIYLRNNLVPSKVRLQIAGSILLLIVPVLHLMAFVMEPFSQIRLITTVAVFITFVGTILHAVGGYRTGSR